MSVRAGGSTVQSVAVRLYDSPASESKPHPVPLPQSHSHARTLQTRDRLHCSLQISCYFHDGLHGPREGWKPATPGTKFHPG